MDRYGLLLIAVLIVPGFAAGETTFIVDRTDDDASYTQCADAVGHDCSLRGAVVRAHQEADDELVRIEFAIPTGFPIFGIVWLTEEDSLTFSRDHTVIDGNDEITIACNLPTALTVSDGQITVEHITFSGQGAEEDRRAFRVGADAQLDLRDMTIRGFHRVSGSAVFNLGRLNLLRSTVTGNSSLEGVIAADSAPATNVIRSTISGNTGEGIRARNDVWIENSTITDNTGDEVHVRGTTSVMAIRSTIIDGTCNIEVTNSQGANLESPGNTCDLDPLIDQIAVSNLFLLPLGGYGGPTATHLPQPQSPAVDDPLDVIDENFWTDEQRGLPAPVDGNGDSIVRYDSGSVERQPDDIVCPVLEDVDAICVLDARDVQWMVMRRGGEPPGWDDDCTGDGVFGTADHECVVLALFD